MKLDKEQLAAFFERYIREYRKFLEKEYPIQKDEFTLYHKYPYALNIYTNEKILKFFYFFYMYLILVYR